MRALKYLLGLAVVLAFPLFGPSNYYVHLATIIMIYSIVTLGLDVVFGYTGEVSIGHSALVGIGAYIAAMFAFHWGMGLVWAIIPAVIISAGAGMLLALPALQVTGPYLAMVTLAFGTIIQILINETQSLTNGPIGITLTSPVLVDWRSWADTLPWFKMNLPRMRTIQFYWISAAGLFLALLVVGRLLASRYGRAFEALRDSPIASDCMAVSVYRHKVMAFTLSAAFAGFAGALFAYSEQYVAPNNFSFELSITFLLAVTMGGRKSRTGPILGAAIVVLLPNILADIDEFRILAGLIAAIALLVGGARMIREPDSRTRTAIPVVLCVVFFIFALNLKQIVDFKLTIFGAMILFVVYYLPDGIFGWLRELPILRASQRRPPVAVVDESLAWSAAPATAPGTLLEVRDLLMQFGGLKALNEVSLTVTAGTVHGLIGPNGSGKSTMMNVLTGIYMPTAGTIAFAGRQIAGQKPAAIAASGIARTFQNVQLFGELTCLENILVGLHHLYRGGLLDVALADGRERREDAAARVRAAGLLRFVGLEDLANEEARNLPYGKQRLLEIARALALDPKLLLLDEPAAGLTAPDIIELLRIIRKIRDHGITMILIEHHMDVVMGVCDRVTVLDFGQIISEGTPAEVQADPRVISAYLGSTHDEAA